MHAQQLALSLSLSWSIFQIFILSLPRPLPLYLSRWVFLVYTTHSRFFCVRIFGECYELFVEWQTGDMFAVRFHSLTTEENVWKGARERNTHTKRTRRKSTIHSAVLSYFSRFICSLAVCYCYCCCYCWYSSWGRLFFFLVTFSLCPCLFIFILYVYML